MDTTRKIEFDFETVGWGALLIWWGIRWTFEFLPNGTGLLGTGFILLGLNALRTLMGITPHRLTTTLGILITLWGGLYLGNAVLHLPFELPVHEIMLIVVGGMLLSHSYKRPETNPARGS